MEKVLEFVKPELLILIPVLYFVGSGLKKAAFWKDKHIPLVLGGAGVILSLLWLAATSTFDGWQSALLMLFAGITQGVLCAGCAVFVNQIWKQSGKRE